MIHDILETSKAGLSAENEGAAEIDLSAMLSSLCEPYMLIAKAKGINFCLKLPDSFKAVLPPQMFEKQCQISLPTPWHTQNREEQFLCISTGVIF